MQGKCDCSPSVFVLVCLTVRPAAGGHSLHRQLSLFLSVLLVASLPPPPLHTLSLSADM